MKIIILSSAYPLRGGIAHFIGLLYNELKKEHDVKVITLSRQYPKLFFPGKSQIENEEGVDIIPSEVLVDSINPFNWFKIGNKIKKEKADLLLFKYWMPFFAPCFGTISRIVKKNNITKVLTICDNVIPHEKKPGDLLLTKYFFDTVDYFILLSKKVQNDLIKLFPHKKNKVLLHPIYSNFGTSVSKNEARKYLKINENEKVILFFGFIREYKGLDILLDAMNYLKDKINIKLMICGEFYENSEKYLDRINELQLSEFLYLFTDYIPNDRVKYYFSAVDCVILPYKSATQSGIVQIAMNFRKPVIATDVGGLSEIVINEKTGYIVEKENPIQLAEAILKFYNENKEDDFVKNIEFELEKYSWKKFVVGIMELISNGLN